MTPLALWNARAAGHDAEQVVDALVTYSRFAVPQPQYAARTLYRHAFVFVSQELARTDLAVPSRIAAFESALGDLPPDERAMIAADLARSDDAAPDELFTYGIEAFVDGLEDELSSDEIRQIVAGNEPAGLESRVLRAMRDCGVDPMGD